MSKTVYTVIVNMPGYLPQDDEPFATTNRSYAEKAAAEEARRFREDGYIVSGNARNGYSVSSRETSEEYVINIDSMSAEEWTAIGNELPE